MFDGVEEDVLVPSGGLSFDGKDLLAWDGLKQAEGHVAEASGACCRAVAFDLGLDPADGGQIGTARLTGEAAVGGEPGDVPGDPMAPHLDAAVVAIGRLVGVEGARRRGVEEEADILRQRRPVVLAGEQIVGPLARIARAMSRWHPIR